MSRVLGRSDVEVSLVADAPHLEPLTAHDGLGLLTLLPLPFTTLSIGQTLTNLLDTPTVASFFGLALMTNMQRLDAVTIPALDFHHHVLFL